MPVIKVPLSELNLSLTLRSGQCFRWKKQPTQGKDGLEVWLGVIGRHVVSLAQDAEKEVIHYEFMQPQRDLSKKLKVSEDDILREYFHLDISLLDLYNKWSEADPIFKKTAAKLPGVRVMKQDPVENVFSFICATCNNIKRISGMVDRMCTKFGDFLLEDEDFGPVHSFPSVQVLAEDSMTNELRDLGFGFRAKYINAAAKMIINGDIKPLETLASPKTPTEEARQQLMKLPGIGKKVADCILLFSMGKTEPIPVDTHVYQIACKYYMKGLDPKKKTVSDKEYQRISSFFQDLFGSHAGWAHSVLFTADLKL